MGKNFKQKNEKFKEPRINNELKGNYDVRVVYQDEQGENKSEVMSLYEAKKLSDRLDLDLIEINQFSTPPILKIANYSKWLYEQKKTQKANKQKTSELK